MTILVHNWAGNPPVLVAQLRYIEKKISIQCLKLKIEKKSKFWSFDANSVENS